MGFWETVIAGALAGLLVVVLLGLWARLKGTPASLRRFWHMARSLLGRFPLRIVRTGTLASLRSGRGKSNRELVIPEPDATPVAEPLKPLTLRERCEAFADEMEGAIAKRDTLPYAIQARYGDYKYFLPRLAELRQELVYDKREPPQPLNFANVLVELSRHDALRMVAALRSVKWESPKKKPSTKRVIYLGPGDMVELDDIRVKQNEGIDLTDEQILRIRTDPTQRLKNVAYRYTGRSSGEYYQGIPARDLAQDDYASLSAENRALVDNGKLYSRVEG